MSDLLFDVVDVFLAAAPVELEPFVVLREEQKGLLAEEEADQGSPETTAKRKQQVVALLERFLAQSDVSGRLKKEAQGLLDQINLQ